MNQAMFDLVLRKAHDRQKSVLCQKATEYARSSDRLWNFKKAATLCDSTPEKALLGMLVKHLVSVSDLCRDLEDGIEHPLPLWVEKIGDSQNYLLLLEALILERYGRSASVSK